MKILFPILMTSAFLLMLSCNRQKSENVQVLNASSFEEKMNRTSGKTVLDVRTPEEYQEGHLANSILIDINREDFKEQVNKLDKSKPVFVYCLSGGRSQRASAILKEQGFSKVYHLGGGIREWTNEGKPVVK